MADYKKMYFTLFNAVTDTLEKLNNDDILGAMIHLASAQCKCEELYMAETGSED